MLQVLIAAGLGVVHPFRALLGEPVAGDREGLPQMSAGAGRLSFHDPDGSVYFGERRRVAGVEACSRRSNRRVPGQRAGGRIDATRQPARCDHPRPRRRILPGRSRQARTHVGTGTSACRSSTTPHEWIPEQLAEACVFTLGLADELRKSGWDLKDGNARNVLFDGLRPSSWTSDPSRSATTASPCGVPRGRCSATSASASLVHRHPDSHPARCCSVARTGSRVRRGIWIALPLALDRQACVLALYAADAALASPRCCDEAGAAWRWIPQPCRVAVDRTIRGCTLEASRCFAGWPIRIRNGRPI